MAKGFPFGKKAAPKGGKPNPFAGGKAPAFGKNPDAAAAGPPVSMPFKKGGKVKR
jgi:hypothetical protein